MRIQLLLKDEMEFRNKNFNIMGCSLKSLIVRGGGGGVFEEEGWYPNAHYDYTNVVLQNTKPKKYVNRGVTIESTF